MKTAIQLSNGDCAVSKVEILPCRIQKDSKAQIDVYFKSELNENNELINSFRGRPLIGNCIKLPENYEAILINDENTFEEDDKKCFKKISNVNEIIQWNLRHYHNVNDFQKSLEWISLSEIVHSN